MGHKPLSKHPPPYPPDPRVMARAFDRLRRLARGHRVHPGSFAVDTEDRAGVDAVRVRCSGLHMTMLSPTAAMFSSLSGSTRGMRYRKFASMSTGRAVLPADHGGADVDAQAGRAPVAPATFVPAGGAAR